MSILVTEVTAKQFPIYRQRALADGIEFEVKGREENVVYVDLIGDPEKMIRTALRGRAYMAELIDRETHTLFDEIDIAYIQSQPPVRRAR